MEIRIMDHADLELLIQLLGTPTRVLPPIKTEVPVEAEMPVPPVPVEAEIPPLDAEAEVPVVPLPPAVPVTTSVLDVTGVPWDPRIHASSKALLQDGTWRQKRGVDPVLLDRVTAEVKEVMAVPASPYAPITFPALVQHITKAVHEGQLTQVQVIDACKTVGVAGLPALAARPDLCAAVAAALEIT